MNAELIKILSADIRVSEDLLVPDTSLDEAGVDSLAVVELSVLLTERLGITVADEDIARAATLGDIDRLVVDQLEGHGGR
ncbi:acyl carrier protein [Saccharothrix sp.]|uniref:acyl carrier protein n=1 Tax=Saccharothrix sp. TaxID=1873460 RepID=UPI002810D871|nr:acyl carrier protein [Saccharothrix sp.]